MLAQRWNGTRFPGQPAFWLRQIRPGAGSVYLLSTWSAALEAVHSCFYPLMDHFLMVGIFHPNGDRTLIQMAGSGFDVYSISAAMSERPADKWRSRFECWPFRPPTPLSPYRDVIGLVTSSAARRLVRFNILVQVLMKNEFPALRRNVFSPIRLLVFAGAKLSAWFFLEQNTLLAHRRGLFSFHLQFFNHPPPPQPINWKSLSITLQTANPGQTTPPSIKQTSAENGVAAGEPGNDRITERAENQECRQSLGCGGEKEPDKRKKKLI